MGYTTDDEMVRVDVFKPSGKWYTTESVRMADYKAPLLQRAYETAINAHFEGRCCGMLANVSGSYKDIVGISIRMADALLSELEKSHD